MKRAPASQAGAHYFRMLQRFASRSRISFSSFTSAVGSGGTAGAGWGWRFKLLMPFTARNSTNAMMMKLITAVTKLPHAKTAPCFLASSSAVAVTVLVEADEVVGKIDAAQSADQRHDHVADERTDDRSECAADDHADGEIDDVAFKRKFPEFFQHTG